MRTRLLLPLLALLFLLGCASLETNAYRTIGSTAVTVDTAMQGFADATVRGLTTPEQQMNVKAAYNRYQEAMRVAKGSVTIYRTTKDQNQLTAALDAVAIASAHIIDLALPLPKP